MITNKIKQSCFYTKEIKLSHVFYFSRLAEENQIKVIFKDISYALSLFLKVYRFFDNTVYHQVVISDDEGNYFTEKHTYQDGSFVSEKAFLEADIISNKVLQHEFNNKGLTFLLSKFNIPKVWINRYYQHQLYSDIYWELVMLSIPATVQGNGSRWAMLDRPLNRYLKYSENWNDSDGVIINQSNKKGESNKYRFIFLICNLLKFFLSKSKLLKLNNNSTLNPKIAIEYVWGVDLDHISDLYWYKDSNIDPSNIIIYLNRKDKTPTREEFAQIQVMGFTVIDLSSLELMIKLKIMLRSVKIFVCLASDFSKQSKSPTVLSLYWWLKSFLRLGYKTSFWSEFFSSNNIRAHMSHSGDIGSEHVCQSIAAELSGAINTRSNYSYTSLTHSAHSREFHTYFLWGEQPLCAAKKILKSKTEIITGYPFDYLFYKKNQKKYDFGKTFSLGLFDTTISRHFLITFYTEMFYLANKYLIKLVIKPKKDTIKIIKSIYGYLDLVDKDLIIIEDRSTMPYEVSKNVDLSVCIGINSAGIEAALSGNRSVYWVPHKYFCRQLDSPNLSLIYYDIKELAEMIANLNKDQILKDIIGNHESFIDKIDPWMDGRAGERIGSYLFDYIDAIKCNESRKSSLEIANSEYSKKWGANYVIYNNFD